MLVHRRGSYSRKAPVGAAKQERGAACPAESRTLMRDDNPASIGFGNGSPPLLLCDHLAKRRIGILVPDPRGSTANIRFDRVLPVCVEADRSRGELRFLTVTVSPVAKPLPARGALLRAACGDPPYAFRRSFRPFGTGHPIPKCITIESRARLNGNCGAGRGTKPHTRRRSGI